MKKPTPSIKKALAEDDACGKMVKRKPWGYSPGGENAGKGK